MKSVLLIGVAFIVNFAFAQIRIDKTNKEGIPVRGIWSVSFPNEYTRINYSSDLEHAKKDGKALLIENKALKLSLVFVEKRVVIFDYSDSGTEYYYNTHIDYPKEGTTLDLSKVDLCVGQGDDCIKTMEEKKKYINEAYAYYLKTIPQDTQHHAEN
ncbi:MAG: hypothetical protein NZ519_08495 [Bacteroidia bacterium]|nr:hypothetical protein [Bacteroidia bacterium]MDW8301546.1 hypothetical protein [Bacteroidia bacterium]